MCIYCGTTKYRKIYEQHFGSIPREDDGRTYEIHHIDGNHSNNEPSNLVALSLKEHYDLHYAQGDYTACHRMAKKLALTPEEISRIGSLAQRRRVERGEHNFLGGEIQRQRVDAGTHHLLSGEIQRESGIKKWQDGTHHLIEVHNRRKEDGSYKRWSEQSNQKRIENGTHNWLCEWTCAHCGKTGKNQSLFVRWGHHDGSCLLPRVFVPKVADPKIYSWRNVKTGESVNMTRTELARAYNLRSRDIYRVINKKIKTTKGWSLIRFD